MALKYRPVDPGVGKKALGEMYREMRRADKVIAEAEEAERRLRRDSSDVDTDRFPVMKGVSAK